MTVSRTEAIGGARRVGLAWLLTLVFSDLPDVLLDMTGAEVPAWLPWGKLAALAVLTGLCLVAAWARPLWPYGLVLIVFDAALVASAAVDARGWWQRTFHGPGTSFTVGYLGTYLRDLGVAAAVIAVLYIVKRRRAEFFLVRGRLDAPVGPVRWLGIRQGESWRRFGWIFGVVAAVVVMVPTLVVMRPSPAALLRAAPFLPACLLFAAVNAFTEEVYFRATLLSILPGVVGRNQALLMNVALFGLAHWLYGTPSGITGFAMTGFLAYLLGKSMLETRGLFWPWLIHVLPDVTVFSAYAVAWAGP